MDNDTNDYEPIILDDANPTIETVQKWAYQENLLLIDQDEDLILQETSYVPVLISAADDPHCPKREYICSILTQHICGLVLYYVTDEIRTTLQHIEESGTSHSPEVTQWIVYARRISDYCLSPRPLGSIEMDKLAADLLTPPYTSRKLVKTGRFVCEYTEYMEYLSAYKDHLYINQQTGKWIYGKSMQLSEHNIAKYER